MQKKASSKDINEKDELDSIAHASHFSLSIGKHEHDLYNDDDNIKEKLISVRRKNMPKKGEDWEIYEDNKSVLLLKGNRFSNKERDFLRTADGMNFLISGWKKGFKSVLKFKNSLKDLV
jgi:hypothetical protein